MLVEMLSHSTVFTENSAVYRGMINGRRRDPIEIQCFCKLILNMSNYLCITCFYLILGKNDSFYKLKQCIRTSSESATFTYNFKSRCFTKNIFQFTYLNIFFFLYEKIFFQLTTFDMFTILNYHTPLCLYNLEVTRKRLTLFHLPTLLKPNYDTNLINLTPLLYMVICLTRLKCEYEYISHSYCVEMNKNDI